MGYEVVQVRKEGAVGIITLNRPPMNPLNNQVYTELGMAAAEMQADAEVKAVIVTGAGEKAFAAGADVAEMVNMNALDIYGFCATCKASMTALENMHKPVVAAIHGFALGGGLEIALCCDFRIASEKATLGLPEINLGIIPGSGGSQRLARLVGANKAKELIFFGDTIDAATALSIGLVNKVVPAESLMDEAMAYAGKLAKKATPAMKMAKEAINTGMNMDLASALTLEVQNVVTVFASEDGKEGLKAFMEKRKPTFVGR